jgi:GT2 family glycosyltransferase
MPYYDRPGQLFNTLISYGTFYFDRKDVQLVIVEDIKNYRDKQKHNALLEVLKHAPENMRLTLLLDDSESFNPARKFNMGVADLVNCEYIVITNPECMHLTDVLAGFDDEFEKNKDAYVICGCQSAKSNDEYTTSLDTFTYDMHKWYQHSEHNNRRLHFCTAIRRFNYMTIGGFDERFCEGLGYDDDDFRDTVTHAGFAPVLRDDLLVLHCYHARTHQRLPDYRKLVERNKTLYSEKTKERGLC